MAWIEPLDVLPRVIALLQREGRVSYRGLQLEFGFGEVALEALREELVVDQRLAADEGGRVLVWTGGDDIAAPASPAARATATPALPALSRAGSVAEAERRQLTVVFCQLDGPAVPSDRLDAEELRELVCARQETAAAIVDRFEGHVAQYLDNGLLIYFGFPLAHEDDVERAVRTALGIAGSSGALDGRENDHGAELSFRVGVHTGQVVMGDMGGGRHEQLAFGETPNLAARLLTLATPGTVVISANTARLVKDVFELEDLGAHRLKGIAQPLAVSRVVADKR